MVRDYAARLISLAWRRTLDDLIGRTKGELAAKALLLLAALATAYLYVALADPRRDPFSGAAMTLSLATALLLALAALWFVANLLVVAPYLAWRAESRRRRQAVAQLRRFLEPAGPEPVRDRASLTSGLLYSVFGDWAKRVEDLSEQEAAVLLGRALGEFQQLACDGALTVWGRAGRHNGAHRPLPGDIWAEQQVEWFSMLDGEPATEYIGSPTNAAYGRCYALMVSKAQVEHLFRGARTAARAA